jgi:hypothetical protein
MTDETSSGWGRLFLDRAKLHDDLRLLGVALTRRWDIGDEFKEVIIDRLQSIIIHSEDDEIALKAIGQVRQMEAQNQRDEHAHMNEFLQNAIELAKQCGIDVTVLGISQKD